MVQCTHELQCRSAAAILDIALRSFKITAPVPFVLVTVFLTVVPI